MNTRILTILLVGLAIVGCKPKDDTTSGSTAGNSIVGNWTMSDKSIKDAVIEFKDGGDMSIKAPLPEVVKGSTLEVDATYKIDADKLTFHMVGTKLLPPDGADAAVQKQVDDANKKLVGGPKKADETDTLTWKDKDTFTATDPKGVVTTYTRKT